MSEFEIRLENLKFFSHHGLFDHELRDGNEFEVNLFVKYGSETGPSESFENEISIEETISYVTLFEIVKEEMETPRKLLETAVRAIVLRIKRVFPFVTGIECNIKKITPPIKGFIGSASVSFRYS